MCAHMRVDVCHIRGGPCLLEVGEERARRRFRLHEPAVVEAELGLRELDWQALLGAQVGVAWQRLGVALEHIWAGIGAIIREIIRAIIREIIRAILRSHWSTSGRASGQSLGRSSGQFTRNREGHHQAIIRPSLGHH